jgi:predicted TIM-barrel fold metal-dependent hydrolase
MSRTYDVIDADGHVLEPADLWTKNIESKYRDRAPKIIIDTDGRERLLVEGMRMGHALGLGRDGSVGVPVDQIPKMKYADGRKGGFDPHARIKDMDLDGIDAAYLYPTLGLRSGAITDPEFAAAVCRTYNCWIADYCRPYPDRLFGIAMLPLQSIDLAVKELRYARQELGLKGGFMRPNLFKHYNDRLLCDSDYDPLWAEAQELDMFLGFHEGTGASGMQAIGIDRVNPKDHPAKHIVSHTMEMMIASLNIIWGGVCERFPTLRFAFLESGGGWMAAWLDRMDRHHAREANPVLRMKPSDYFRRQCWISFEPVEGTIAAAAQYLGPRKLLWATDYPHPDGFFPGAPRMIADKLPDSIRRDVMAQGAIDLYKLN